MRILYLDVDGLLAKTVKKKLAKHGFQIEIFTEKKIFFEKIAENGFEIVVFDFISLTTDEINFLNQLSQNLLFFSIVMVLTTENVKEISGFKQFGCHDYVFKDITSFPELLLFTIENAVEKVNLIKSKELAKSELIACQKSADRVQSIAKVGNWEYYIGEKNAKWSNQEFKNFGYQPDSIAPSYDKYIEVIHPEDRANVEKFNLAFGDGKSDQTPEFIFRLLLKNNEIRYIKAITEIDVDQKGEVIRVFGVSQDITQQKLAESDLKLADTVFNTTTEAIFVIDVDNIVLSINPAFTKISGYLKEQIIGQQATLIFSGYHEQAFFDEFWCDLNSKGNWEGEFWVRHLDGHFFPTWQSVVAIKDAEGRVVQYVSVFSDISKRKQHEQLIQYQANYDGLTALPNRHLFLERMNSSIKLAERNNARIALFLLDLDRFKWINDTLGHKAGDFVLQETARRLKQAVRASDTVARLGGDEFTVILSELESSHDAEKIADKIFKAFAAPVDIEGSEVFISGSIGISIYPDDGEDAETLQKNADSAMYSAKEAGRNRYHYFTSSMHEEAERRLKLINYLRRAIEREEFAVYYQPVIDIVDHVVTGAEALIRWKQPELGYVSPADFIPLAEETGLIREIGDWVLLQVAQDIHRWQAMDFPELQISINKSPKQFIQGGKENDWSKVLTNYGVKLDNITVEITESVYMERGLQCVDELSKMQEMGIKVSLDDFGTGYSSLSYLKRFPVDILKIDREFINDLATDPSDALLVETIITLAEKMHFNVIAEGVETIEQLEFLKKNDCRLVQGFYYSKPLPRNEFETYLNAF